MRLEFHKDEMRIIPEDARDSLFMGEILNVSSGKIFVAVDKNGGRFGDDCEIILRKFEPGLRTPRSERGGRRNEK